MIWQILSDPFVSRRLCLALLHSLWAVALLAMIAWLLDRLWLKLSVERSYALHVGALLLSLAVLPVAFAVVRVGGEDASVGGSSAVSPSIIEAPLASSPQTQPAPRINAPPQEISKHAPTVRLVSPTAKKNLATWNRIAPWLAGIYAIGVLLMFGRLLISIWRANRLGSRATPISEGPLLECLRTLSGQWSLRVVPVLARAEHIVVPKVVGLLKPTILFPAAALSGLSPDELEMILAHELAHVRRHDMWVNLLQRLAEVVLFFNPALWYLSRRISTLREYCCDEMTCQAMAGAESKNDPEPKLRYASALLHVAELAKSNTVAQGDLAALAASGRSPSELRRRVARLFGEPVGEPVRISWTGLLSMGAVLLLFLCGPMIWRTEAQTAESTAEISTAANEQESENSDFPATISGKIVLEDGSPATAKGWLYSNSRYSTGSTLSTEGQFTDTFSCEVHSGTVWLKYFPKGYAPAWVGPLELKPGQRRDNVTFTLRPGFSELVQVSNEQGEPVAGATLLAHPEIGGNTNGPNYERITDENGEFLLEHLADTRYSLTITAPGYQPLRTAPLRLEPGEVLRPTMIRSKPGTGVVRFADGTPAPGTKLYCKHEIYENGTQNSYSSDSGKLFVTCDAMGRFSLDQLATGSHYLFIVEAVDGARGIVTDLRAGQEDVQIVLPLRRDLVVKVLGDLSSLPKRRGKPFIKVQQRIDFQPTPVKQASELFTGYATVEPTAEGGMAIFRGLAVDLRENADTQQVAVLLGDSNGLKKIVDLNLTGGTNVKFVLPGAVDKKIAPKDDSQAKTKPDKAEVSDRQSGPFLRRRISDEEVQGFEAKLLADPKNLLMRSRLLRYYFGQQRHSPDIGEIRNKHIVWIIQNRPEAKVAGDSDTHLHPIIDGEWYFEAKKLWLQQVEIHNKDAAILGNAAAFLLIYDKEISEDLLKKAQALEPKNPKWPKRLGHLYSLGMTRKSDEAKREAAAKSLAQRENALLLTADENQQFYLLADLALAALEAGEWEKSGNYARQLISEASERKKDWNYGNAIHHGNQILGRIALAADDLEKAKKHLLESGKTPGSPQLNSFGPSMVLAKELLKKGEREVVLEYFQQCGNFWKRGGDRLKKWTVLVRGGEIPEF